MGVSKYPFIQSKSALPLKWPHGHYSGGPAAGRVVRGQFHLNTAMLHPGWPTTGWAACGNLHLRYSHAASGVSARGAVDPQLLMLDPCFTPGVVSQPSKDGP
jgi:hypothetical protein